MTTYEARPERDAYAIQEEIKVHLRITNGNAGAIELGDPSARGNQPTYTVRGAGFEKVFSTDSLLKNPLEQKPPPQGTIRIAPGATWEATVPLQGLEVPAPGLYELASRIDSSAGAAVSEPVAFRVTPPAPDDVGAGTGVRPYGNGEGEIALLHRTPAGTLLYSALYFEPRPELRETKIADPVLRSVVGANAQDVSVPRKNTPIRSELIRWVVWRESATISAISSTAEIVSATLPEEPRALIRPALKEEGGPLDVLALAKDGKHVHLVRFKDSRGSLAWTAALPTAAGTISVAMGSPQKGNVRHLAFATHDQDGIVVFHSHYARDGALAPFKSVRYQAPAVEGKPLQLLQAVQPALFIDRKEAASAAVVAVAGEQVFLLEAHFAAGLFGDEATVKATRFAQAAAPPVGGALLYVDGKDGSISRREGVLQLADSTLVRVADGVLQPLRAQTTPTRPMLLLPGREVSYLLCTDDAHGLSMTPVQ